MRKHLFFLIFVIAFSAPSIAQNITLESPVSEVRGLCDAITISAYFDVRNTGTSPLTLGLRTEIVQHVDGTINYFCWAGNCYPDNVRESPDHETLQPNQVTSEFIGYHGPNQIEGVEKVRYIFYDVNNPSDFVSHEISYMAVGKPKVLGSLSYCSGEYTNLAVDDLYDSYLWSNGDTNASIQATAGTYHVQVVFEGDTVMSDTVVVAMGNELEPVIKGDLNYCANELTGNASVMLDAGPGYDSYLWSNGDTTRFTEATAGNLGVDVSLGTCIGSSDSVTVVENVNPTKPNVVQTGSVFTATNADYYMWFKNDEFVYGSHYRWYDPEGDYNGSYKVFAIDDETGCGTFSDDIQLSETAVGIEEIEKETIKVYPNPASQWVTFQIGESLQANSQLIITNMLGEQVGQYNLTGASGNVFVSVQDFSKGIYLYQLISGGEEKASGKLLINR